MDQDLFSRELWEQTLQVIELRDKTRRARFALGAAHTIAQGNSDILVKLLQNNLSEPSVDVVTQISGDYASLQLASDAVCQRSEELVKTENELIAAENLLCAIEERVYAVGNSSSDGHGNGEELHWEEHPFGMALRPWEGEVSQFSEDLFASELVGGDITVQLEGRARDTTAGAQRHLTLLGDTDILREQLVDLEAHHRQLVQEYHLRREIGLEKLNELRNLYLSFIEQLAAFSKKLKEVEELAISSSFGASFDHDLHFTPSWRNLLEPEIAAEAFRFENEADTGNVEDINWPLLLLSCKGAGKAAGLRASQYARKDALDDPLLAQPERWLNWPQGPRRGRGQRKNKSYWNARKRDSCFNPFERECLFSGADGGLVEPAVAQLDSLSDMPFCVSLRYLKKTGREHEISTNFADSNLPDMRGVRVHGIVRNMAFRVKGTSTTFHKDFLVAEMLDDLVDVVFGWNFMASEFKVLFEKASDMFSDGMSSIKDAVSSFSMKAAKVSSAVRRRASDFISRAPSPSPPYSLCDMLAPDFYS